MSARRYVVPGRVELVGKHVDYAGGRSLTCAADRAVTAEATPLGEPLVVLRDAVRGQGARLSLTGDAVAPLPRWGRYGQAVVRRLARDFGALPQGVEIALRSELPSAAGLSSSSALLVALTRAVAEANGLPARAAWTRAGLEDPLAFAEYAGAIESGGAWGSFAGDDGVGTRGGSQDHVAICCARAEMVGCFAYRPARVERYLPWPDGWTLAIAVSGVVASKTGNAMGAYNRTADVAERLRVIGATGDGCRSESLREVLATWRGTDRELCERAVGDGFTLDELMARVGQFREESEVIVPGCADALAAGDVAAFGALVARSQALAESALDNQVPETVALVRLALSLGAPAASAFGAGFGGSVWALVRRDQVGRFGRDWRDAYRRSFPRRASRMQLLVTAPSGPARWEDG